MKIKFLLLSLFLLVSCGGDSPAIESRHSESAPYSPGGALNTPAPADAQTSAKSVSVDEAGRAKQDAVPIERKIIRSAELTIETASPEESLRKVAVIAEAKEGFVVESTQTNNVSGVRARNSVTVTIRIPSAKFAEALDEIRKSGTSVLVESIKGQDVTEEFVDIEARLKTQKALEEQFIEIMKQGKTVEDALRVQKELSIVRGEIERIEGRKRFLENQSSLSTIRVQFQTPGNYTPSSPGFFNQLVSSFSNGFDFAIGFVLKFITFIIAVLPFFVLVVLPVWFVLRYLWRRRLAANAARKATEPEEVKTE